MNDVCFVSITFQDNIVRYKAPELWTGAEPSFTSDVWSMGISILEVLTGGEVCTALTRNDSGEKIPERLHAQQLPEALDKLKGAQNNLVEKCLKWEPDERISAREIANRLKKMLD